MQDFVGHKYGPESEEMRVTLAEMDRQLARILAALEARVGKDYLLAETVDHGMPSLPPSPDHRHFSWPWTGSPASVTSHLEVDRARPLR